MSEASRVEFRVYDGPSLAAPFAAIAADFQSPFAAGLPPDRLASLCAELLPPQLRQRLALVPEDGSFEQLAGALANAIQDINGPNGLAVRVQRLGNGVQRILLGYHDATAATMALRAGLELAAAMFGHALGRPATPQSIENLTRQMTTVMQIYQPDHIARALLRVARRRGIPAQPIAAGSRTWLYGQGCAGCHFFEAANERDSMTGTQLARNKYLSNQLVTQLGFRGVVHGIADSMPAALQLARQIGFPVVAKPVDSAKGSGVTAGIRTEEQLQAAFAKADAIAPGKVIVERHVAGDDHRIAVMGGRFAWAVRRSPPRVVGDAKHTIAELMEIENRTRSDEAVAAGFTTRLAADADVLEMLGRQGLGLQDRPAAGRSVLLRSVANTTTGGTVTDCTALIHPDNREMAESIARGFRLDAIGIDFMTTDIGTSWRDSVCAVIEVNPTPGFSSDVRAELVLRGSFPDGDDGRIPSVVVIEDGNAGADRLARMMSASGRRVGQASGTATVISGQSRFSGAASLPARVRALLLDPSCEALVISATAAGIELHGFPLDRCDLAVLSASHPVSGPLLELIRQCAGTVVGDGQQDAGGDLPTLVQALLARRAAR